MTDEAVGSKRREHPTSEVGNSHFGSGYTQGAWFSPVSVLARAELLDHARQPRNRGELPNADIVQTEDNPLCGDVVAIFAVIASGAKQSQREEIASSPKAPRNDARITRMSFTGTGCIISQAAASMLTEHVVGKSITDIEAMERADMEALIGGTLSPSRVKCAVLTLTALKKGIEAYMKGNEKRSVANAPGEPLTSFFVQKT